MKTLLLYSRNDPTPKWVVGQTVLRGIFKVPYNSTPPAKLKYLGIAGRKIANYYLNNYDRLGYVNDWYDAFISHPELDVETCDINNLLNIRKVFSKIKKYKLIIVLHSATGDNPSWMLKFSKKLLNRECVLGFFIGNEFDLLPSKKALLESSKANYVFTQLPLSAGKFLYSDIIDLSVLEVPHAANTSVYRRMGIENKNFDNFLCFNGASYPSWIGDSERNNLVENISTKYPNLCGEFKIGLPNKSRDKWASILSNHGGTVGAAAGTYYLDRLGLLMEASKKSFHQKKEKKFKIKEYARMKNIEYVSGKALSSRHFEAMASGCTQILIENNYHGLIESGVHYIGVKKDLSNLDQAIDQFKNKKVSKIIAERAYELIVEKHTYRKRIDHILHSINF